ncbi:hypothetical protein Q5762_10240 [Streptomyces sp. P9(2023)]|uniref:hypothetical protein n=1 Tax=Streptomyces sp. P9(2023) TaxID=3064394 RepID=UPI0028F3E2BB|nr:hypothetical protein [Streptomyces sp. P9(2023)]MDT9688730.1 hypothetical protein [Streptomyces sp. P9(2023)]
MRKLGTAIAALGLAAIGLAAPATTAQAAELGTQGAGCNAQWPGRDGYVRAWDGVDCRGAFLGGTAGNDPDWNAEGGGFMGASDRASSVMNSGYYGGKDVVAFYRYQNYAYQDGYTCLAPGEKYADYLGDNRFFNGTDVDSVDNDIRSHLWVYASACAAGSWLT